MGKTLVVRGLYNRSWEDFGKSNGDKGRAHAIITGYEQGDRLEEAWREVVDMDRIVGCAHDHNDVKGDTCYCAVCDWFFWKYNYDERPNRLTERSLSVGDIIEIAVTENEIRQYACIPAGWHRLDTNTKCVSL